MPSFMQFYVAQFSSQSTSSLKRDWLAASSLCQTFGLQKQIAVRCTIPAFYVKTVLSFLTWLFATSLAIISPHALAESTTSSKICGAFGCEKVPVPNLPKPSNQNIPRSDSTSTDLYCETMAIAFVESLLDYKPTTTPAHAKQIDSVQAELLDTCKSMPTVGGVEKKQSDMSPQELSQISCLGIAEGIATAQASKTEDRLLYSKLNQNRQFFANACTTNRKEFLSDMKRYGPYHVLSKKY